MYNRAVVSVFWSSVHVKNFSAAYVATHRHYAGSATEELDMSVVRTACNTYLYFYDINDSIESLYLMMGDLTLERILHISRVSNWENSPVLLGYFQILQHLPSSSFSEHDHPQFRLRHS